MTDTPPLTAHRYPDGSLSYPGHPVNAAGEEPVATIDLSEHTGTVVTWTTAHATPPGVRSPNSLAVVEFEIDDAVVRVIGQLTTDDIAIGDDVRPVYAEQLRDPEASLKTPASQDWDGYRFVPADSTSTAD